MFDCKGMNTVDMHPSHDNTQAGSTVGLRVAASYPLSSSRAALALALLLPLGCRA